MGISLSYGNGSAEYVVHEAIPLCFHGKPCHMLLVEDGPRMICKDDGRQVSEIYRNDRQCPLGRWWLMNTEENQLYGGKRKNLREECDKGYTEVPELDSRLSLPEA